MHNYKEVLRYYCEEKQSQRFIAKALKMGRSTVSDIIKAFESLPLNYQKIKMMSNEEIEKTLFPGMVNDFHVYLAPDFSKIHEELLKPGVTLQLLWEEYVASAKSIGKPFYHRSYFFEKYSDYVKKNKLTMHLSHKPADRMMVDWDGKTLLVCDRYSDNDTTAYLFVATLPFSMKTFVRACPSMDEKQWIISHIEAYKYFDGVTRLLIPDNLKTGVISHKKNEDIVLNKVYQEMADYYGTTIIPARVKKPKDKAAVEGEVGDITNYLFGRLRNMTFFSFEELNKVIKEKMEDYNNKSFQKRDGSRNEVYEQEEKPFMKPLPIKPFELCEYKVAKVNIDYHISVEHMNYSVPHEYVGNSVDVKITDTKVEIYYKGTLIANHPHLKGRRNQYSTIESHMPESHKMFLWNGERFRSWAKSVGNNTYTVIDNLLSSSKVEETAYRGCISILKLSDTYTNTRLEKACKLALEHLSRPGYKNIKMILQSNQDITNGDSNKNTIDYNEFAFLRGGKYYGENHS